MLPELRIYTNPYDIKYILFEQTEVISDVIRKCGTWLEENINFANKLLLNQDSGNVIDVGAGIGSFSIPVSLKNSQNLNYHCFEPLNVINMQLNTNILINNIDNIYAYRYALGNRNETIEAPMLDLFCTNHGSYSFNKKINEIRGIRQFSKNDIYEFRTIDSFNFKNVKLIKVSSPGTELDVLFGAVNTIKENNFPPIIFESWGNDWYAEEKKRVMDFFASQPYEHYCILGSHMVAFKTKKQFDDLMNSSNTNTVKPRVDVKTDLDQTSTVQSPSSFLVEEEKHETNFVLETQKPKA